MHQKSRWEFTMEARREITERGCCAMRPASHRTIRRAGDRVSFDQIGLVPLFVAIIARSGEWISPCLRGEFPIVTSFSNAHTGGMSRVCLTKKGRSQKYPTEECATNKLPEIYHSSRPSRRRSLHSASQKCETQRTRRTQRKEVILPISATSASSAFHTAGPSRSRCHLRLSRASREQCLWYWRPTFLTLAE